MPKKVTSRKLVIVVGPTASGKSELAVKIAKEIAGEIISADSRQIYKGMDIGSGKVAGKWTHIKNKNGAQKKVYLYKKIPHYLIDEASPRIQYSVTKFQKKAQTVIEDIFKRGKIPIICGGTAHWVDSIAFGQHFPEIKPNKEIRTTLAQLTTGGMYQKLIALDPARAKTIDPKNHRRLIRALEIIQLTGKPVPPPKQKPQYDITWLGLDPDPKTLETKIHKRLKLRLNQGMLTEVEHLHKMGLSWKRLESFGLEYKFCALLLQGNIAKNEFEEKLFTAIRQYTKRQKTWWKRNLEIRWAENPNALLALVKNQEG